MENESKGLGDTIKKLTGFFGIPTCQECQERADWLNTHFPYSRETPTEEHVKRVNELLSQDPIKSNCKELNALGKILGGHNIDSCFCTETQRSAFRRDFQNWWATYGVSQ